MIMKKLRSVFFAVLTGCLCAFFLFKEIEINSLTKETSNAVAIQIGVFKDQDKANRLQKLKGGVVIHDEDLYRVYYSILHRDENIDYITSYLRENDVNYYLKSVLLDKETLDKGLVYELEMAKEKDKDKLTINAELITMYKEVI